MGTTYESLATQFSLSLILSQLARLYNQVLVAEREQQDVDNALDHIEQQQKAISSTLEEYEKLSQDIFGGSERGNHAVSIRALDSGPADTERDKKYETPSIFRTGAPLIWYFAPLAICLPRICKPS